MFTKIKNSHELIQFTIWFILGIILWAFLFTLDNFSPKYDSDDVKKYFSEKIEKYTNSFWLCINAQVCLDKFPKSKDIYYQAKEFYKQMEEFGNFNIEEQKKFFERNDKLFQDLNKYLDSVNWDIRNMTK